MQGKPLMRFENETQKMVAQDPLFYFFFSDSFLVGPPGKALSLMHNTCSQFNRNGDYKIIIKDGFV
jgi:hypothetical protein